MSLFQQYAEDHGATLRELQEGSFDQLRAQLHPGEKLFGVAEGVDEELPIELQLMLAMLGIIVTGRKTSVASPLDEEIQYLAFRRLVQTNKPKRLLYYAVSNLDTGPSSSSLV